MAFTSFLLLLLLSFAAPCFYRGVAEPTEDRAALLAFLAQVPHEARVNWSASASACSWVGVQCDANQSRVIYLRLPGVGLVGPLPPATVGRLSALRVLSLRSNRLSGPLPSDLANLTLLRSLYLQDNRFSGDFPAFLAQLPRLVRLDLSSNRLDGEIPFSVNNLTQLTGLFLQGNNFSGPLPSISIPSLGNFNVSSNNLNGSIPKSLSGFPESSFAGNIALCGEPLSTPCTPFFNAPSPSPFLPPESPSRKSSKKLSRGAIIAIAVASAVALLLLLLLLLFCCLRRRSRGRAANPPKGSARSIGAVAETGTTSSSKDESGVGLAGGGGGEGNNKLMFFDGGVYSFDLEDLLRASAEVLGKGSIGTSYKAVLEEGTTVVVKRLKDVAAGRREFEQQMEVLGRVKHDNVVPLRAYYYSKDEKLLVSDFMAAGSLSALLHGSRGSGRTPLDWDNRMKIALAAGRGIAHLHAAAKIPHGNIKASNVLLRPDLDAAVSDFGLAPLFSPHAPAAPNHRVAGYRAPEVVETRKPTFKSDVYSYGVLLLELLTGKAPNQAAAVGGEAEGIDLPRWVQSVVREEWTAEVFDVELMRYQDIEEEMVQLLQVAMACVATAPDQRPDFPDVLRTVEEMARPETDDPTRQLSSSDGHSKAATPPAARTP